MQSNIEVQGRETDIKNTLLILATSSPHRQAAFKLLDLDFVAQGSNVDEYFEDRPDKPNELVMQLAKLKAQDVAKNYSEGIIIGFDSVGEFQKNILEKPKSREEAFERLKALSGNSFDFYTGIYVEDLKNKNNLTKYVHTKAFMREISEPEINKYLNQDPKYNTYALGFDPLGNYSSTFIKRVEGSYNNLTRGIPLEDIVEMLTQIGYRI